MEGITRSLRTAARGLARRLWAFKVPVGAAIAVLAASLVAQQVAPSVAVLVAVALGVLVVLVEQRRQHAWIDGRFEEVVSDVAQIQPLLELGARLQPRRPLPPLRGYAITPDFALMLTTLIAEQQPELVVETGSGVSTLVIAYALEKLGRGRVVALELDAGYAAKTRDEIERHGLSAYATVVHAPLAPIEIDGKRYTWHSLSALEGLDHIDLVIDDGPPRYLGEMLRYASLPTFAERLSRRGLFVLDFVADEERETLALWKRRHPEFAQEHLDTKKGNVILRRAPTAAPTPAPLTVSPLEGPKPQMP